MYCGNCRAILPAGAAVCPSCGTPVPYNVSGNVAPTVQAQPSYPQETANPQVAPTVFAQSPDQGPGGPSGAYYNQGNSNPNNAAPPPPSYYNPNPGASQPGISGAQYNQVPATPNVSGANYNPYANSAPPPPTPYPSGPQPGAYPQPGGYGMPPQPPKKKSSLGLILGIIGAIVLFACIGSAVLIGLAANAANKGISNVQATATAISKDTTPTDNATPTTDAATPTTSTGDNSQSPSGRPFSPLAQQIITDPVTSSAVNSDTLPTSPTKSFTAGSYVYVTFKLKLASTGLNFDNGDKAYVEGRFYADNEFGKNTILTIDRNAPNGYVAIQYLVATQGAAELYWCRQADCSDRQLAQVVTFTVS
ncbi:hypothetical protein KSD_11290 [Ktedonobacter sp. SOSP1-85]|uniref:zinc ribbon domain-containing protein n=1 Tax=Ktedonobacter sp. SOSP1-85 TaxID=2778367 RepID=UPI00191624B9|nr:zinc ribbon domain-containing protein [Ktedonobacter sp. SOSP1-85]GHO73358.1 hypothetical protein KSD_11290 [Ktedonobacter sp. SOSP1-85]